MVGRGCLGRPWLFRDLADVFAGREPADRARASARSCRVMLDHARRLAAWMGSASARACATFRKHATWYTKGFTGSARMREVLTRAESLAELARLLEQVDGDEPFPQHALRVPRGKSGGRQRVALPDGFLDDLDDATPPPADAEDPASGG